MYLFNELLYNKLEIIYAFYICVCFTVTCKLYVLLILRFFSVLQFIVVTLTNPVLMFFFCLLENATDHLH